MYARQAIQIRRANRPSSRTNQGVVPSQNAIRHALHSAARHYASKAHEHWLQWRAHHDRAFIDAMRGHQVDRMHASHAASTHRALYEGHLSMALRCREMMK